MKPIGVGLILVLVITAATADPILVEESTARVEEILVDTKSQPQGEQLSPIQQNSEEVNNAEVIEQVVKGQPSHSKVADKLPSVKENALGDDINGDRKRAQRMYTETYTYLTAEDIGDMLRKLRLSGKTIKQSRSAISIAKAEADGDVVQDTNDKSHKDKVYVLALVEKKNTPLVGLGSMGEKMLSIAAAAAADNESEARYTKKALNKYLRRMYRKLRRSVKKYKRKASFRSNDPMTVEKAIRKTGNKKKEDQDIYKLLLG